MKGTPSDKVLMPISGGAMLTKSLVQQYAMKLDMSYDEFVGEMRKLGCSEPTTSKIWYGDYEEFKDFDDKIYI